MDADKWTDAELKRLEARIAKEYKQASEELQEKAIRYFNGYDEDVNGKTIHHKGYYERKAEEYKAMQKGVYSQDDYNAWMYAQLGRGEHWEKLRDQMSDRLNDANKIAQDYANGILPKVYTTNYNYVAKIAQDSAMEQGIMGIKFDLIDEYTVKRLMEQSSEVRPYKPIEISLDKNTQYNKTKLQNALLQGILQGESVQKIATRFAKATNMQRACAIRNARTAVTGARNAGKQDRYADLASKGCQTFKKWKATADERTRTEHMQAWSDYGTDDKAIPYDEPFDVGGEELMYPADRVGSPWNIYNCRCTMASVFKFKSIRSEYSQKVDSIKLVGENTGKEAPKAVASATNKVSNMKEARKALTDAVGFEKLGRIGTLNEDLLVASTNQLINLESRFNVVHSSQNSEMIAKNYSSASAYVQHSVANPLKQILSLCPRSFAVSEEQHTSTIERMVNQKWSMPTAPDKYIVYDVTHEYGHMLENKILADMYSNGYASKYLDFAGRIDYSKSERMALKDIKDEIIGIAKANNPSFNIDANISQYGKSSSAEFFAEVFANSQLGQPNELGDAMNAWLVQKGY